MKELKVDSKKGGFCLIKTMKKLSSKEWPELSNCLKYWLSCTHQKNKFLKILSFYRKIEKVVSPQKWDVLIRIIDNADQTVGRRSSAVSTESTTTYGGRKTTASSQSAQELRSMSEVMVDYGYNENRSGYSGRSSTYTQAVSSNADRSGK